MKSIIVLVVMMLSLQAQSQEIVSRSIDNLNNIFIVSDVFVPKTEGDRTVLGLGKDEILLFDESDNAGLVMSCEKNLIEYYTSKNFSNQDIEIEFESRNKCEDLRNIILNTDLSVENHIKFIFNLSEKKLEKVSVP